MTYCWNSTLTDVAERSAMVPNAVEERTMVVPSDEGLDLDVCAWSTILTWTVWYGRQVPGKAPLMHFTSYCLPQAEPLSHILSPAAANMLLNGNCDGEFPSQAVAASQSTHKKMLGIRIREKISNFIYGNHLVVHVAAPGTYVNMGVCSGHRCQHRHVRDGRVLPGAIRVEM